MSGNLSIVLHKKGDLRLEEVDYPGEPGPNEVQLDSKIVGVCGSDIHFWKDGGIDKFVVDRPTVLGHEASAVVVKVGSRVSNVRVGDRVAIEPGIACLNCQVCKDGNYNICPDVQFQGVPPLGGSLTRRFNLTAAFCHKLPDNISDAEGALMEPLAVAVYACKRANLIIGCGYKVMVTGAGPVGLLAAMSAKALGAQDVCILDINESRLNFAKQLGISKTILIDSKSEVSDLAKQVIDKFGGQSPHVTLECSGAEMSINLAIHVTRDGGDVVLIGVSNNKVNVNISSAAVRQVNLLGIKRYLNTFPLAIHLVSSGELDIKPLITHTFKLEDGIKAFETARDSAINGAIKVHIRCNQ
ncbi:sorbitol dehydrogenase-like [Oppia nitens]|uniref:sorbitol dehydrogenase-like n=1 Tax=Oppia nitens TaxID=1686743 RepID=UPI0023D9B720|nr:sorbitol dehydrogenase-like [Oppia nitens]